MFTRYFTEDEQSRLLRAVRADGDLLARRDAAWINLLLLTGLRIGEFSRLTVAQVLDALTTRRLFIPREHRKGKTVRTVGADGKPRERVHRKDHTVLVTRALDKALRDCLRVRDEMLSGQQELLPDSAALFVGRDSQRLSVRQYQERFKVWVQRANLPAEASPHWLRHSRAKNILRRSSADNPLGIVKSALDHASLSSTGVYTEPDKEEVLQALEQTDGRPAGRITRAQLRRAYQERNGA